jgi:hypothetical protein
MDGLKQRADHDQDSSIRSQAVGGKLVYPGFYRRRDSQQNAAHEAGDQSHLQPIGEASLSL